MEIKNIAKAVIVSIAFLMTGCCGHHAYDCDQKHENCHHKHHKVSNCDK